MSEGPCWYGAPSSPKSPTHRLQTIQIFSNLSALTITCNPQLILRHGQCQLLYRLRLHRKSDRRRSRRMLEPERLHDWKHDLQRQGCRLLSRHQSNRICSTRSGGWLERHLQDNDKRRHKVYDSRRTAGAMCAVERCVFWCILG